MRNNKLLQQNEWKAIQAINHEAFLELKHILNTRLQELGQSPQDELKSDYLHKWIVKSLYNARHPSIVKEVQTEINRLSLLDDDEILYEFGSHLSENDCYEYAFECGYNECDDYWHAK